MTTKATLYGENGEIVLTMAGTVDDAAWKDRQQVCEKRFENRVQDTMRREKGAWVVR
jgi:hypothetical protein